MYQYYYRVCDDAEEVIIQVTGNTKAPLSIQVTEENGVDTAMVNLPVEEIDRMIRALKKAKDRIYLNSLTGRERIF